MFNVWITVNRRGRLTIESLLGMFFNYLFLLILTSKSGCELADISVQFHPGFAAEQDQIARLFLLENLHDF